MEKSCETCKHQGDQTVYPSDCVGCAVNDISGPRYLNWEAIDTPLTSNQVCPTCVNFRPEPNDKCTTCFANGTGPTNFVSKYRDTDRPCLKCQYLEIAAHQKPCSDCKDNPKYLTIPGFLRRSDAEISREQILSDMKVPRRKLTIPYFLTREGSASRPGSAREDIQKVSVPLYDGIKLLTQTCHAASVRSGWWTHHQTGLDLVQVINSPQDELQKLLGGALVAQKLCLGHSEISEAMEGHRKGLMDDKLPHRKMIEVELADALIRIGDLAEALKLDLAGAVVEKLEYNATREDHKPENRVKDGGKTY